MGCKTFDIPTKKQKFSTIIKSIEKVGVERIWIPDIYLVGAVLSTIKYSYYYTYYTNIVSVSYFLCPIWNFYPYLTDF